MLTPGSIGSRSCQGLSCTVEQRAIAIANVWIDSVQRLTCHCPGGSLAGWCRSSFFAETHSLCQLHMNVFCRSYYYLGSKHLPSRNRLQDDQARRRRYLTSVTMVGRPYSSSGSGYAVGAVGFCGRDENVPGVLTSTENLAFLA